MAKAQTMAIIMGRSGLPLGGFIVPELEGTMLIGGGIGPSFQIKPNPIFKSKQPEPELVLSVLQEKLTT
ncbi:hypothetical protein CFP56_009734 [Quercus suber]|uniref:Uncharacterized protein n=1 Tax=Quercus suber TaxID=58331 RepID=A0AAW0L0M6_QUESU